MKRMPFVLVLFILSLPGLALAQAKAYVAGPVQTTAYGQVAGAESNEGRSLQWLGIPYAAPPVGELRWRAPRAPSAWEGVRQATSFSSVALQASGSAIVGDEDCLYLNVFRPNSPAAKLPVLLYIHGGNNQTGSAKSFSGEVLAAQASCVVVTINYRLGALGWLSIPAIKTGDPYEDSGNFGLLDIRQALAWIKDDIIAFGGDPGNVTVSGQSAGGRDVMAILISPIFKGYFDKAFCISGGMTTADPGLGRAVATAAIAKWVVEDGLKASEAEAAAWLDSGNAEVKDYLMKQDGKRVASIMTNASIRMAAFPHLFADGAVLPKEGFAVFKTGAYNKAPTLLGSCDSEFTMFALGDPAFASAFSKGTLASDPVLGPQFDFAAKYGSMLYASFNADRSAEAMGAGPNPPAVYAYRFLWGEDATVIGSGMGAAFRAYHGIDLDFITGREDSFVKTNYTAENKAGRVALSAAVQAYLGNFLRSGDPNGPGLPRWEPWSPARPRLLSLSADRQTALIGMGAGAYYPEEIFAAMDADSSLGADQKRAMTANVMSGRFFSPPLDARYNGK
jgi:Carboxylesterase type B